MNWTLLMIPGGLILLVLLAVVGFRAAVSLGGSQVQPVDPSALVRHPVEEVHVEYVPGSAGDTGAMRVSWAAGASRVGVFAGPAPYAVDWSRPLAIVSGVTEARLAGVDPASRTYFGVSFVDGRSGGLPATNRRLVAAERFLPLIGARNFRDVGGYVTQDGRRVRWGRIFRSDRLSELVDVDLNYLSQLHLHAVCDLRSLEEREEAPDRMPKGAAYYALPVYENQPRAPLMNILLFRRHQLGQALGRGYVDFLEYGAGAFGQVLRLALEPPIVYHCTAGKDRTGIATALLLGLLGVPDEVIVADYSLSNLAFDHFYQSFTRENRLRGLGVPNHQVRALFMVDPAWMESLLGYLRETYGAIEDYLIQKAGLDEDLINRLRETLLE